VNTAIVAATIDHLCIFMLPSSYNY
jgi:hypothetical protein